MLAEQRRKEQRFGSLKKKAESREQLFGAAVGSRGHVKNVIRKESMSRIFQILYSFSS